MAMLAGGRRLGGRPTSEGLLYVIITVAVSLAVTLLGFVGYAMWPSAPAVDVGIDAPSLPITVAGGLFDVPPQAIRAAVQRHAGAQERVDLVYLWPSLVPPEPNGPAPSLAARDRVFLTIAAATSLAPIERLKAIYPHYAATDPTPGPPGLAIFPFRDGSPYQGEELVFDAEAPEKFLARCARTVNPLTPGTCLAERRIGNADVTARFPRDWLDNWRDVEAGLEKLIGQLRPAGAS
jgi:hypothetical protein